MSISSSSHAATCEEWDDEAQTTVPHTRTSANVAAKRSKPELVANASHQKSSQGDKRGRGADTARKGTGQEDKENRADASDEQKIDNSGQMDPNLTQRESRLYSSGPPAERTRPNVSRPPSRPPALKMPSVHTAQLIRHAQGQCWSCDTYGHHLDVGISPLPTPKETSQRAPSSTKTKAAPAAHPRPMRPQLQGTPRPTSFHAGMLPDSYIAMPSVPVAMQWQFPSTPISPYTPVQYPPTPTSAYTPSFQDYPSSFEPQPNPPRPYATTLPVRLANPPPAPPKPQEPVVCCDTCIAPAPNTENRSRRYSQNQPPARRASHSRENDAKRMPPPSGVPASRRPSMAKEHTIATAAAPRSTERNHGVSRSIPTVSPREERKLDSMPPPSYRDSTRSAVYSAAQYNKAMLSKSSMPLESDQILRARSSGARPDRRSSCPTSERHELEAEFYQQAHRAPSQALTIDAVRKMSRKSDTGSQQSLNSGSRASSGGKTKTTAASNDANNAGYKRVNLDISLEKMDKHSITIQRQAHGTINISVDDQEPRRDNHNHESHHDRTMGLLQSSAAAVFGSAHGSGNNSPSFPPPPHQCHHPSTSATHTSGPPTALSRHNSRRSENASRVPSSQPVECEHVKASRASSKARGIQVPDASDFRLSQG